MLQNFYFFELTCLLTLGAWLTAYLYLWQAYHAIMITTHWRGVALYNKACPCPPLLSSLLQIGLSFGNYERRR